LLDVFVYLGHHVHQVVSNTEQNKVNSLVQIEIGFLALISKNDKLEEVKVAQMIIPGADNEEYRIVYI
jgi:hypothetical protein